MSAVIHYEIKDNIAVISVDNPPVNALSQAVRQGLMDNVARLNEDEGAAAGILICAGRTFIAGADISEFNKPPLEPLLPDVVAAVESSNKILVAAIHGTALGGGFETAMACHYRCALSSARVGLPEVKLGLLPGATGTQRLPRLVGVERALELLLTGNPVPAEKAVYDGAIDRLMADDLLTGALEYTRELLKSGAVPRRLSEAEPGKTGLAEDYFDQYRKRVEREYRGYFSPLKIVECVEAAVNLPYPEAVRLERRLFNECMASNQSRALRYLFFAEREVTRVPGVDKDTARRQIEKIAIVGAGTMGSAIAINFLYAGLPVLLLDKDDKSLEHGVRLVRKQLDTAVSKGRLTAEAVNEKLGLLTASLDYSGLRDVDLVVESGYEDMAVKEEIFRKLDGICKAGAILASNTSTLDLDRIGGQTRRPPDVIGMHFFAPADRMRLLEIIRTKETAADVLATTMDLSRRLKKTGVVVGVCFGFVGNRMFLPYLREAQLMALEGVSPAYIDRIACDWGMAMGPFAVMDLSGLDVFYRIYEPFGDTPNRYCYFPLANVLFHRGKLGRKSGTGFYQYDGDEPVINPELDGIIHSEAERHGIAGRQIDDDEIIGRLLFSMVNEGAMILEEGIALRPGDIDVIFVHGFGFPRYRGGPMCYADTVGTRNVYKTICDYRDRYGDQLWTPAGLLGDLAGQGEAFSET